MTRTPPRSGGVTPTLIDDRLLGREFFFSAQAGLFSHSSGLIIGLGEVTEILTGVSIVSSQYSRVSLAR